MRIRPVNLTGCRAELEQGVRRLDARYPGDLVLVTQLFAREAGNVSAEREACR